MKKFLVILICVLFGAAAIAWAVDEAKGQKEYSWRYKMTVEIDTPEGIKTGSAVREVRLIFMPNPSSKNGYNAYESMKGEAIVIDLGERGKVFAVQSYDNYTLPFRSFKGPAGRTIEGAEFYSQLKASTLLKKELYPRFVVFQDLNDPMSVQLVYGNKANEKGANPPYTFQDNFEAVLGEGVHLKQITIEMTDEPVEYHIPDILPWVKEIDVGRLDGNRFGSIDAANRLANSLSVGAFTTHDRK